jgi:hypothetical protein
MDIQRSLLLYLLDPEFSRRRQMAWPADHRASLPLSKCLFWFDINKEADWRISSSPESEAAFIRMAKDPYFNPWGSGMRGSPRGLTAES